MNSTQFLLLALLVITLCWSHAFADIDLFAAKELQLKNAKADDAALDRPFEVPLPAKITTAKGDELQELANCRDYLAVYNQITGSDNETDYHALLFQTVPCAALALLKSASIAKQSALPKNFHNFTKTTFYPATLWPAVSDDERKSRDWSAGTLLTYTKQASLRKINKETLGLENSGWGFRITLLARGDFDHDGWEDAAFRWEGYALESNYTDVRLVVLTRTNEKNSFLELPAQQLLAH